jgi:HTH-type transcriptional regulator / antitoxin HigA
MGWDACGVFKAMTKKMDIELRIIKTEEQYRTYLAEVDRLAADDPAPGTADGDRLELLAKLIEDYEKQRVRFRRPDPVEAILFRMQERGLRQKDLAPVLGGKNRVSEILARKRPLTLSMVRALSDSLQIPADLLIREPEPVPYDDGDSPEISLPLLVKSGWFGDEEATRLTTGDIVRRYLKPPHGPLYLKHTITYGSSPETNKTNLRLWVGRVREIARETRQERGTWHPETLNEEFLSYVARLSWSESGPRVVKRFLAEKGIALVVLPALPRTRLDGAAMVGEDGAPIVGLTIRNDRLDSFWHTLVHELAHAWKHLSDAKFAITDEDIEDGQDEDAKEAEANRLAREAFIPRSAWKRSEAFLRPSVDTINSLANKLHISPAVIAGRLRRERVGYNNLSRLVGHRRVRRLFDEVKWK